MPTGYRTSTVSRSPVLTTRGAQAHEPVAGRGLDVPPLLPGPIRDRNGGSARPRPGLSLRRRSVPRPAGSRARRGATPSACCETKSTVRPEAPKSCIRPRERRWNSASLPTALRRRAGSRARGSDGGEAHVHAARVPLHGRVHELLDARELDDRVHLARDLPPLHPQHGPVQVDVLHAP